MCGGSKTVIFSETMLDAGYLMLEILEFAKSEIHKHAVSRNQYPGSRNITNDFHYYGQNSKKYFRKLNG
jgi:hypothetical protein